MKMRQVGKKCIAGIMAIIMLLTMILSVPAMKTEATGTEVSYPVTGGNIIFDTSTGTVTNCDWEATRVVIPEEIGGVSVISIGKGAFEGCDDLISIEISEGVISIGERAFATCDNLVNIEIPASVKNIGDEAFSSCGSLSNIKFPEGVEHIGEGAFRWSSDLRSIEIPASVMSIGDYAFDGCIGLVSINVDEKNTMYSSLDDVLFNKDQTTLIRYPSEKTQTAYVIPSNVTSIKASAFEYCINLNSIEIPPSVTSIEDYAFEYCTSLSNIEIPEGVTSIGERAFYYCVNLNSINISSSVTNIGDFVFEYCYSLNTIDIDNNNRVYSSIDGVFFNKNQTTLIQYPIGRTQTTYKIPANVTSIETIAFAYCSDIVKIEIPEGVTSIGGEAFTYCTKLSSIKIPSSVTSIGSGAFIACGNLSSIEIPPNVTSIDIYTFLQCVGLRNIKIPSSVTSIYCAFSDCDSLTDVYYEGSEEDWNKIEIECLDSDALRNATIHFNSSSPGHTGSGSGDAPSSPDKTTVIGDNTEENNEKWSVGSDVKFEIPEELPLIGGGDIDLDFGEIPVQFEREGNTFRMGIGVRSLEDLDEKGWTTFKKFVETQKESYRKGCNAFLSGKSGIASMGMNVKPDFSFFAYAEGTITKDGIQSFAGKSFIEIKGMAEQKWQTVIVIPIVVKFSGEAGVAVTNSIGLDLANSRVYTTGKVDLTLPKLKLSAGVGVAYIADISVYGSAKNVVSVEIRTPGNGSPKSKFTGTLSGELGISATLLFFSFEKALIDGDWEYYSSENAKARLKNVPNRAPDQEQWEIKRADSSVWNGTMPATEKNRVKAADDESIQVLQPGVYIGAKPTLLKTDSGKKVIIYTTDILGRTTGNHTAVVYSVYDETSASWTDPVQIENDGTADFDAVAAVDGENVYIAWSDANRTFTTEETEVASADFMKQVAGACEITAAKLDLGGTAVNVEVYSVTDNAFADMKPAITVNDHIPYISWYENRNNDILEGKGINIVHMTAWNGSTFVSQVSHEVNVPVQSVAVGTMGENILTAWESFSETEESISVMDRQENVTEIVSDAQTHRPSFTRIDGKDALLWYAEDVNGTASLQYINTPGGEVHTCLNGDAVITSDYKVINGDGCELVVCASSQTEAKENGRNLYAYVIRGGQISEPVTLTEMDGYASDPSGIWNGNAFEFLFASTNPIFNKETETGVSVNEKLETTTDLCLTSVVPQSRLEMGEIEYTEENMMPGDTTVLTVPVTNDGLKETGADGSVQVLYGTEVIGEAALNHSMEPGQTEHVEVAVDIPAALPENATLTVQSVTGQNENVSDAQHITSGRAELNLAVEQSDIDTFSVIVSNTSGYDAPASLSIKDETGAVLTTVDLNNIAAGEQITQSFRREEFADSGSDTLVIEVTSGTQDLLPFNNTAYVYVGEDILKTLDHLTATKTKVEYARGETLNLDDLEIKAVYTDGSEKLVIDYTTNVSEIDMTVPGEKELVITYEEVYRTRKVTMPITVINKDDTKPEDSVIAGSENDDQTTPDGGTTPAVPEASSGQNIILPEIIHRPIKIAAMRLQALSNRIAAGKRIKLTADIFPVNASNQRLIWSSSNPKVATVSQSGVVKVKKKTGGKSVIITARATDGSGVMAVYRIKSMKGVVKKVTIAGTKKRTVKAGQKLKLKTKVTATKGANKKLLWTSSNTKYATVSASGKVKTKKLGRGKKVKITAMATDGSNKKMTVILKLK